MIRCSRHYVSFYDQYEGKFFGRVDETIFGGNFSSHQPSRRYHCMLYLWWRICTTFKTANDLRRRWQHRQWRVEGVRTGSYWKTLVQSLPWHGEGSTVHAYITLVITHAFSNNIYKELLDKFQVPADLIVFEQWSLLAGNRSLVQRTPYYTELNIPVPLPASPFTGPKPLCMYLPTY